MTARRAAFVVCSVLFVAALPFSSAGCAHRDLGPSGVGTSPGASAEATEVAAAQAQEALEQFLAAWEAHDVERYNSFVGSDRAVTHFDGDTRIEVGEVRPLDLEPGDYGYGSPDMRRFSASIRFWGPGLSVQEGSVLDWAWELRRGPDGRWRVVNWGYG